MGTKRRRVRRVRRTVPPKPKPKVIAPIVEELDGDVACSEIIHDFAQIVEIAS